MSNSQQTAMTASPMPLSTYPYSALYLKIPDENLTLVLLASGEGVWWDNPRDSAQVQQSGFAPPLLRAFR